MIMLMSYFNGVVFLASDSIMLNASYASARPPVRPSLTRVDQSKGWSNGNAIYNHTVAPYLSLLRVRFHEKF